MVNSVTHSQADGMDASCGREKRTSYPCLIEASKWNGLAPDNRRSVKTARSLCPRVKGLFWRCPTVKKTVPQISRTRPRRRDEPCLLISSSRSCARRELAISSHRAPHFCVESLETIVWYWRLMRFASVWVAVWHGHFAWNKKVSSK